MISVVVIALRRSCKADEGQDEHHEHDKADEIDDAVHVRISWNDEPNGEIASSWFLRTRRCARHTSGPGRFRFHFRPGRIAGCDFERSGPVSQG